MPTPSLLIVPARFKSGKLYSQIPTSGVGDFTVTRATTATRVNASGLIESVASGIPRLDYFASGGTVGCPALLIEASGTNLLLQSEAFNTTWTRSSGGTALLPVITANDAVSPDGNQTADKIDLSLNSGNTTSDISWIYQNNTLSSGQIYAGSVWLKAATQADIGKVIQVGYVSYQSYTLTADWVRITLTQTPSSTGNYSFGFRLRGAQGTANSASFYAWGAQLETGSVATSYIPTTTASVTRNADVVSVSGAVSGSIGQTSGTFYIDLSYSLRLTSTATRWFQVFGSSNNIGLAVAGTNVVRSIVNGQSDILSTPSTSGGVKIAWGYDGSGVVCFVNGTQYTLTNGGAQIITQLNQIFLDLSFTPNIGNCRLRAMALYTTRLTNAELQSLTQL